jgi:hypothetical protein
MQWGRQIEVIYIEEIIVCPVDGVGRGSDRSNNVRSMHCQISECSSYLIRHHSWENSDDRFSFHGSCIEEGGLGEAMTVRPEA